MLLSLTHQLGRQLSHQFTHPLLAGNNTPGMWHVCNIHRGIEEALQAVSEWSSLHDISLDRADDQHRHGMVAEVAHAVVQIVSCGPRSPHSQQKICVLEVSRVTCLAAQKLRWRRLPSRSPWQIMDEFHRGLLVPSRLGLGHPFSSVGLHSSVQLLQYH